MARSKGGNGHDAATDEMIGLLRRIADRLDSVETRLETMDKRIETLDTRLSGRLDSLIELAGMKYREHEERLAKVEAALSRLETRRTG